jgi:hypothetical protein
MENQLNFSTLKVGDKVYSRMHGKDVLIEALDKEHDEIFKIKVRDEWFTVDGRFSPNGEQMLFPSKPLEFPREVEIKINNEWVKRTAIGQHDKEIIVVQNVRNNENIYFGYSYFRELQPTLIITREMLIEKFGTDNYTIEG